MKIAIIHSELNKMGGSQRQAIELCLELNRLGHEATMYSVKYDKEKCFPELCANLRVVSLDKNESNIIQIDKLKKSKFGLMNFVKVFRNHNKQAEKLAYLIDYETDAMHSHNRIGFRTAYYFKKKIKDIPSVLMVNDIMTKGWSFWRKSNFDQSFKLSPKRKFFYWLVDLYETNKFMKKHEAMTVLDNRTKDWAKNYYKGIPAYVVRSGMDANKFIYSERASPTKNNIKLLAVGIFFMHRRYEDAIRAVKILNDEGYNVSLDIIGGYGGSFRPYYEKLVALVFELGLNKKVRFVGKVFDSELRDAYRDHHIYLSTNHFQSWGIAVFEAIASGIPTIVSKTAGASEVLLNEENSLIVNPCEPEEIVEAVKKYADNPDLYKKIAKEGRKFVEKNISWTKYAKGIIDVFNKFLTSNN